MTMAPVLKKSEVKKVLEELCALFDDRTVQEEEDDFSCTTCVKLILELRNHVQKSTHTNLHPQKVELGNRVDAPFGGKDEDKEWLERADHPLMNDLVLKRVFEHVRRYDLRACRGVCKKWNEHMIPHMRSTFQITIHGSKSNNDRRIVDFVKLFKSNELGIPFEKYRLGPFRTTDGAGKQFLDICGDFIKEIVLVQPRRVYRVRTIENLSELLKFSPKLEALTISGQFVSRSRNVVKLFPDSTPILSALKKLTVNHDSRKSPVKYCPTFFDELLSAASNICHITIDDISSLTDPRIGTTVVLNSIENLGRESSIQSLSLQSASSEHVEILKRMAEKPSGLKLEGISLETFNINQNSTVQFQLATIFKDSLEDLDMNNLNVYVGSSGHFGINLMGYLRMPKLKAFKYIVTNDDLGHKPVDLNQMFPLLETFNIRFHHTSYDNEGEEDDSGPLEFFREFQVCPTVNTLIIEDDRIRSIRTVSDILRVFPHLRSLTLSFATQREEGGQILRHILAGMTQLEFLSLDGYVGSGNRNIIIDLDSLLTGIPTDRLNEIRDFTPVLKKMTMEDRREKILNLVEEHRSEEPSIRNLTNLKHLKLDVNAGWKPISRLGDMTGYLGIYLMKHLTYLDIQDCVFTETCCEILTMETGVEEWTFKTWKSQHIIPPFRFL